jgi:LuxR family transcriptional regulator, maltose regulon positive regulatory protein
VSVRAACLAQLALLAVYEESWDAAGSLIAQARAEAEEVQMQEHGAMASVFTISALVFAHRRQSEKAHRELAHARRLLAGRTQVAPWFTVEARLILARASLLLADVVGARTLLSEARHLIRSARDLGTMQDTLAELTTKAEFFPAEGITGPSALTSAELRVLHYLPTYLSFPEIAERLYLSKNTIKTHAISIYRKLQVSTRGGAVQRARDLGLIEA